MKVMRLLISALLAVVMIVSLGQAAVASTMFSAPVMALGNIGFNQISPSEVGTTPILFAPPDSLLLHGAGIGAHYTPWLTSYKPAASKNSMSQINQMFDLLSWGVGKKTLQ